jgi:pimeloyl-ACP methyl ester carboxylesterase
MMVWRFKLSMALLTIISTGIVFNATASADELITLTTRSRVTQKVLLWGKANPESLVVLLIFPGGGGNIGFQEGASLEARNEYIFSDNRTLLMREGVAVAVVDALSDNLDMSSDFRHSAIHFKDMHAVSKELKARHPKARLVLLGHSRGTVSAAYVADALGDRISAVILISGFYAPHRFRSAGLS